MVVEDKKIFSFDNFAYPYATCTSKDIAIGLSREVFRFFKTYDPKEIELFSTVIILTNPIERADFLFLVDIIQNTPTIEVCNDEEMAFSLSTGFRHATQITFEEEPVLTVAKSCMTCLKDYIGQLSSGSRVIEKKEIPDQLYSEIMNYFSNWKEDLSRLGTMAPKGHTQCYEIIQNTPTILVTDDSPSPNALRTRLTSVIVIKPWTIRNLPEDTEELNFFARAFPGANLPLLRVSKQDVEKLIIPSKEKTKHRYCALY